MRNLWLVRSRTTEVNSLLVRPQITCCIIPSSTLHTLAVVQTLSPAVRLLICFPWWPDRIPRACTLSWTLVVCFYTSWCFCHLSALSVHLRPCEVACFRLSGSSATAVLLICISVTMLISNTHYVPQEAGIKTGRITPEIIKRNVLSGQQSINTLTDDFCHKCTMLLKPLWL